MTTRSWIETDILDVPQDDANSGVDTEFGCAVDIVDNIVVIGAHNYGNDGWTGRAYVYKYNTTTVTWDIIVVLNPGDGYEYNFGHSISIFSGARSIDSSIKNNNGSNFEYNFTYVAISNYMETADKSMDF